jgi:arabinose-5-phosphate isomerase
LYFISPVPHYIKLCIFLSNHAAEPTIRSDFAIFAPEILYPVMIDSVKEIFEAEARAVMNIPVLESFGKACDLIFDAVHHRKGKVVASGMGKAGQIALNIASTLSATGTPAVFLHPSDAQHGDLGVIQPHDVLLLVSNSGKTREIIELYNLVKMLGYHLSVVVITGNSDSELGNLADVTIFTGNPPEVCPLGLTPTTSTTVMTVIGDALVVLMMKRIGFTAADYAKRHHGGYLGVKSRDAARKEKR